MTVISLVLVALCLIVFGQVIRFDFINFDDTSVYSNPQVYGGLTRADIVWALTSIDFPYWQPLTWLSHMAVCQAFGLNAGWHHAVNLLLHIANTLLVFWVFRGLTGAFWRSAILAALFAVHPLRVESVAWVIERKDLLSGFWFLATLWTYLRYAAQPSRGRYLLVLGCMALGLMAKPMLVTVPFLLLLLDYWPLGRRAFAEKLPMFAMAAASCFISYAGSVRLGAINWGASLPLATRAANALVSYLQYLRLTFWPRNLAILYPYPASIPLWHAAAAAILLAGITAIAIWQRARRPYLFVGWLWFVIGLGPVIGLVQVGRQAYADRFTYIPHIGLLLAVIWAAASAKRLAAWAAAILILTASAASWRHTQVWRDSVALMSDGLTVTENNCTLEHHLAIALEGRGRFDEALPHHAEAVRIEPSYFIAQASYGIALERRGESARAAEHLAEAVRRFSEYPDARYHLGINLAHMGRRTEAVAELKRAIEIGLPERDAADAARRIQTINMQSP